jgi:hypothetical protein
MEEMGKLLNYPDCCVEAFINAKHMDGDVKSYNGFIPCDKHQSWTQMELEIIIGRKLEDGVPDDVMDAYISSLTD